MAKAPTISMDLDGDIARELEEALSKDAVGAGDDLDIAASMEDLEAQISRAAEELSRESREPPANGPSSGLKQDADTPRAHEGIPTSSLGLRPVDLPFSLAPANDDSIRDARFILQSLSRRSSNAIYWTVGLLSLLWIAGGSMLGYLLVEPGTFTDFSVAAVLDQPVTLLVAIITLTPLILFWGFAVMVRRAQDMRLAAQSMAEVAARLAEPENLAQGRILTVGQAVRREVAAMGEGIERTLARAVELEALVHTEVNQLERSYTENEARIRALVDGLGSERQAVVTHAERVRASIAGVNETLKQQLGSAGDVLRDSILGASTKLSMTITHSGDALIERIGESGNSIFESIGSRLDSLGERITTSGEAFASLLDTRIAALKQTSDDATRSLSDLLDERTSSMVSLLGGASRAINEEFDASLKGIEKTLAERGQSLISEFQTRAEAIDTGTQKLNAALEARARQINDTLVERASEIAATFTGGREQLAELIDANKSKLNAEMAEMVTSTSTVLEAHALNFAARLEEARGVAVQAFDADLERLATVRHGIEEVVDKHARKIVESGERMAGVLRADLASFTADRNEVEQAVDIQMRKMAEGRQSLAKAVEEDLRRIDESRTLIDLSLGEQLRKIAEGRESLGRALREDAEKLAESRTQIDEMVVSHVAKLGEGRNILSRALEAELLGCGRHGRGPFGEVRGKSQRPLACLRKGSGASGFDRHGPDGADRRCARRAEPGAGRRHRRRRIARFQSGGED